MLEIHSVAIQCCAAVGPLANQIARRDAALADQLRREAIGFFHASEHLHGAIAAAYGDGTRETQFRHESLRDVLRDDEQGVEKTIRALKHLATKYALCAAARLVVLSPLSGTRAAAVRARTLVAQRRAALSAALSRSRAR